VPQDGYFFDGQNILFNTFKRFSPPYSIINFLFASLKLQYLLILKMLTENFLGISFSANRQLPVFLLAGALLFDEKIRQSAALFWFGLRDVEIPYSRAIIQRTIDVSLMERGF
jgi:hypothetical protein